jgi:hypothetical protein
MAYTVLAESGAGWAAVLASALVASFVGGVLGGTLTTWLRGRIEREEAWRTRLIEAADEFMKTTAHSMLLGGQCLHYFGEPESPAYAQDGSLTNDGREWIMKVRDANREARIAALRIALLFGNSSSTSVAADEMVTAVRLTINTLEGDVEPPDGKEPVEAAEAFFSSTEPAFQAFADAANRQFRE